MKAFLVGILLGIVTFLILHSVSSKADGNVDNGKALYEAKCLKCHGKSGEGDGKSAKALNTQPTDFTKKLSSDAQLFKAIKQGGQSVGLSKEMPDFPGLSDQEVNDTIAYIKTFVK